MRKRDKEHYFRLLKEAMTKNYLLNAPHQIYNIGVLLDLKVLNVVTERGSKKYTRSTGRKV